MLYEEEEVPQSYGYTSLSGSFEDNYLNPALFRDPHGAITGEAGPDELLSTSIPTAGFGNRANETSTFMGAAGMPTSMAGGHNGFSNAIVPPSIDTTSSTPYTPEQLFEDAISSARPSACNNANRLERLGDNAAIGAVVPGGEGAAHDDGSENDLHGQLLAFINKNDEGL